jgi:putative membrane protein
MHGFLGTKASMLSDVSLILETVIVVGIMYAWYLGKKHKSLNHHWLMLVMVLVDVGFLIVYMIHHAVDPKVLFPSHDAVYKYVYLPLVIVHSFISSAAFILGLILSINGIRRRNKDAKASVYAFVSGYRPKHARLGVWAAWSYLISAITGIAVYYMLYMM